MLQKLQILTVRQNKLPADDLNQDIFSNFERMFNKYFKINEDIRR